MSAFALIRPRDDGPAKQASDWADALERNLTGHSNAIDIDNRSPADHSRIVAALGTSVALICYFGHGDEHHWLTHGTATAAAGDFVHARGKAIVSVACKTACNLGPDAVTSGVEAWLGFTSKVVVIAPHNYLDPIGTAIVDGLSLLNHGHTMQSAHDEMVRLLSQVAVEYDVGSYRTHPGAALGYFAALCMRDHLAVHGNAAFAPL